MPIVQVYLYSGKSKEQKNELVKRISRDFEEVVGVKPESLHILFHDMERENWDSVEHSHLKPLKNNSTFRKAPRQTFARR